MNDTIRKFGAPDTLIREYDQWVVLLRPAQVTLGSLVLAAKSEAIAFGSLPPAAHAELAYATAEIEATLARFVRYDKLNYLMLMMVDPHAHFHVFPRYQGERSFAGTTFVDAGWPKPPALDRAQALDPDLRDRLTAALRSDWQSDVVHA
jgi:diadenosine tetraphosphate (Ap4A) HIT family hydrolase